MRKTRSLAALTLAAILALAAAGCSNDSNGGNDSGMSSGSGRTVTVKMTDNTYDPQQLDVAKGEQVTFRFVNDGQLTHEAYIGSESDQKDHETEMMSGGGHGSMNMGDEPMVTVQPGKTGELTHTFDESGTVLIGCHQPGHWASGMKATVTVS